MATFVLVYRTGDNPERQEREDFPDTETAKAFARSSLRMVLSMSTATTASVGVGEVEGPGEGDIEWLGAYDLERGCEPVWREDD